MADLGLLVADLNHHQFHSLKVGAEVVKQILELGLNLPPELFALASVVVDQRELVGLHHQEEAEADYRQPVDWLQLGVAEEVAEVVVRPRQLLISPRLPSIKMSRGTEAARLSFSRTLGILLVLGRRHQKRSWKSLALFQAQH